MNECTHDCSGCSKKCPGHEIQKEPQNELSDVKKVIGVVSGKGGVGKSLVTSLLAVSMRRAGFSSAILDADVTGPSIPKIFGLDSRAESTGEYLLPAISSTGIGVMSVNLLLENKYAPVVWRGPVIAGTVKQFWTDVAWSSVDYMFVDMPPGTGDVPLTVFQSLPIDGIIVVTSPQELVGEIVEKAGNMARLMNVPVLGLVENMSYVECPHCGEKLKVFGDSHIDEIASRHGLDVLAQIPMLPEIAERCDAGEIEFFDGELLGNAVEKLKSL